MDSRDIVVSFDFDSIFWIRNYVHCGNTRRRALRIQELLHPFSEKKARLRYKSWGNSGDAEGVSNIVQNNDAVSGKQPTVEIKD